MLPLFPELKLLLLQLSNDGKNRRVMLQRFANRQWVLEARSGRLQLFVIHQQ
jgi:hypothetical protein